MCGALVAQAFVVLGHKGFFGQGVQASVTVVAGVMPLAEFLRALQAAVVAILLQALSPLPGVPVVVAVKLLSHGADLAPGGISH